MAITYEDLTRTGPGTLAGRYLRRFWQPVLVSAELPVNRAKPLYLLGEAFTIFRGADGEAHLLDFYCAHRGTQLSTGWVQGDTLRCRYHGWAYNGAGDCVEQPAEPSGFGDKIHLRSYPVKEYLGLVFAYLGPFDQMPPFPRYPWFEAEGIVEAETYTRDCNYFYSLDNRGDEVHLIFTHLGSEFTRAGLTQIPQVYAQETEYGLLVRAVFPDGKVRISNTLMPTMNLFKSSPLAGSGWRERIAWRVPIDDCRHASFSLDLVHVTGAEADRYRILREEAHRRLATLPDVDTVARSILAGHTTWEEVADRPDLVNIQDSVTQMGQAPAAEKKPEHLGQSDRAVIAFRRLWMRELTALAEERPLKVWQVPTVLGTTPGA